MNSFILNFLFVFSLLNSVSVYATKSLSCKAYLENTIKATSSSNLQPTKQHKYDPDSVPAELILSKGLSASQLAYSPLPLLARGEKSLEHQLKNSPIQGYSTKGLEGSFSNAVELVVLKSGIRGVWKPHQEEPLSNYRAEVLAYELDKVFGFDLVPVTVERTVNGKKGSVQLFIDRAEGNTITSSQMSKQLLFDLLIDNSDRRHDNYFLSKKNKLVSIDNGISFTEVKANSIINFAESKTDLDFFLQSKEAKGVLNNLELKKEDVEFKENVRKYLGRKDTQKFFDRIEFILFYSKLKALEREGPEFVESVITNKIGGEFGQRAVVDLLNNYLYSYPGSREQLIKIIESKEVTDQVLSQIVDRLSFNRPIKLNSLLESVIHSPKANRLTINRILYLLFKQGPSRTVQLDILSSLSTVKNLGKTEIYEVYNFIVQSILTYQKGVLPVVKRYYDRSIKDPISTLKFLKVVRKIAIVGKESKIDILQVLAELHEKHQGNKTVVDMIRGIVSEI